MILSSDKIVGDVDDITKVKFSLNIFGSYYTDCIRAMRINNLIGLEGHTPDEFRNAAEWHSLHDSIALRSARP